MYPRVQQDLSKRGLGLGRDRPGMTSTVPAQLSSLRCCVLYLGGLEFP